MKKYFKIPIIAAVACFAITGCSDDEVIDGPPNPYNFVLSKAEEEIVDNWNDLGFKLLRTASEIKGNSNFVFSPYSVNYTLAMLSNGVGNEDCKRINTVLGNGDCNMPKLNEFYSKITTRMAISNSVCIAGSIWTNPGINLRPDFVTCSSSLYDMDIYSINEPTFVSDVNDWCRENTGGKITTFASQRDYTPDFTVYNAVYFKGKWSQADKMDATKTTDGYFHNENGSLSEVKYMHNKRDFHYAETDLVQICGLRYGDSSYSVDFFLPKSDVSLSQLIDELAKGNWQEIMQGNHGAIVELSLPKFKIESEFMLDDLICDVFKNNDLDFSGITTPEVQLTGAKQKIAFAIDEENEPTRPYYIPDIKTDSDHEIVMNFNRPFIYAVHDNATGAVLLIGCMSNFAE